MSAEFDDLTKRIAQGATRRRALGWIGGFLAGAVVNAFGRPKEAIARPVNCAAFCRLEYVACPSQRQNCIDICNRQCVPLGIQPCVVGTSSCRVTRCMCEGVCCKLGDTCCNRPQPFVGRKCCPQGQCCSSLAYPDGECCESGVKCTAADGCCRAGRAACGRECCARGKICSNGQCVCPRNQTTCGDGCCQFDQFCSAAQRCEPCPISCHAGQKCCRVLPDRPAQCRPISEHCCGEAGYNYSCPPNKRCCPCNNPQTSGCCC
jgi:hypothetical protein